MALQYTSLGALLIVYPLTILHHALVGEIVLPLVAHGIVATLLASLYVGRNMMGGKGLHNSNPLPFLAMPILFMINYLMLTPLALLTLVTVNWETRSAEPNRHVNAPFVPPRRRGAGGHAMDDTVPHSAQEPRPKQRPRFRLLPDMNLITWLFSLATRAVLLAILLGVLGFLTLFPYFLLGRTWSMPVILSGGHERVIQVQRDWLERNLKLADLDSRVQVLRRQLLETENSMEIARIAAAAEANAIRTDATQNNLEIEVVGNAIARGANERHNASNLLLRIRRLPDPEENFEKGLENRAHFLTDMLARTDLSIKVAALDATLAEDAARLAALERRRDSLRGAQAVC